MELSTAQCRLIMERCEDGGQSTPALWLKGAEASLHYKFLAKNVKEKVFQNMYFKCYFLEKAQITIVHFCVQSSVITYYASHDFNVNLWFPVGQLYFQHAYFPMCYTKVASSFNLHIKLNHVCMNTTSYQM